MHRLTGSFGIPIVGVRVALAPTGVRLLALVTLIAGAGAVVSLSVSPALESRSLIATAVVLALGVLTVLTTVLPLLDGVFRPLLVGGPALGLGLVAAVSIGLDAAWPAPLLAWLLVVVGAVTMVYHLLGRGLLEREE